MWLKIEIIFANQETKKKIYRDFSDGLIIRQMNITRRYILFRIYLDAFCANCPLGSSASKNKVMGVYCSIISDLKICSKLSTVLTLALLNQNDIREFGLRKCLEPIMIDLKTLVCDGYYDEKLNTTLDVRVIASLGDNLGQNEGLILLIFTFQHYSLISYGRIQYFRIFLSFIQFKV